MDESPCGTDRLIRSGGSSLDVRSRGSVASSINGGARAAKGKVAAVVSMAHNHSIYDVSAMNAAKGCDANPSFTKDLWYSKTITTETLHGSPPLCVRVKDS